MMQSFHSIKRLFSLGVFLLSILLPYTINAANVRVKDLADFEGIRENKLVGYGLVVGLNGTGDRLVNSPFTQQTLRNILSSMGMSVDPSQMSTKNIAAVIVTTSLPPFARSGTKLDLNVSTIGDATSLLGGTLLPTSLIGADGNVYAMGQGNIVVGGYSATGRNAQITGNIPTVGRVPEGGLVERNAPTTFSSLSSMKIILRDPDITNADKISKAINGGIGADITYPLDPATVVLNIPPADSTIGLLSKIEQIKVKTDRLAKVVIDERSGVIVIGQNVRIDTVAIAQGNLTIQIEENEYVSQPIAPFSDSGETVVIDRTKLKVSNGRSKLSLVNEGVTLKDLIKGLNALGVNPRDMIAILQSMKAAGALYAEIETI